MSGEMAYRSFRPAPLPPEPKLLISNEIIRSLTEANRRLAELDAASRFVPSVDLFVSMYVRKEALLTSQIEGTQCTLDDVLDPIAQKNVNADVSEVINYVKAAQYALQRAASLPLCNRLLKETHEFLMSGVRGQEKNPGEFRRSQNWIGPQNSTLRDARFIPPNIGDMHTAMSDLEKYMNGDREMDPLVDAALIHYQFETIHPFLDGNGRIGRLLILLYLMEKKLLSKPVIYISYFLKMHQVEYYDRISEVRRNGNYEQWITFFLEAVREAAADAIDSIRSLADLHDENIARLPRTVRAKDNVGSFFAYLEQHPIIDIKQTAADLHLSYNTVAGIVGKLVDIGILEEKTNAQRNRVFAYEAYLKILRSGT
jgi:Fic family protein